MNSVNLVGRLTRDPEMKVVGDGMPLAKFSIAVDRRKKGEVDFIACVCWKTTAELVEKYLKKGDMVGITGRWEVNNYETQTGEKRRMDQCVVNEVKFLSQKSEQPKPRVEPDEVFTPDDFTDADVPF